jgi:hypothetical protein
MNYKRYSGGNRGLGYAVATAIQALCLIICSPKKTFFSAVCLVRVPIGGQKNNPGILYTSG